MENEIPLKKLENIKIDMSKRSSTLGNRKKSKESPKTEESSMTFPRKATTFDNNFLPSETESPMSSNISPRFTFENDFETSEAESPIAIKSIKNVRGEPKRVNLRYENRKTTTFKEDTKISPSSRSAQKSPFEDDFSPPTEKPESQLHENLSSSSIKEEIDGNEEEDSFTVNNFDKSAMRKKILNKNRFSNNFHIDTNLKKSESVNIFARESDPFDDEFFSAKHTGDSQNMDKSPRSGDQKWTDDFEDFDFDGRK